MGQARPPGVDSGGTRGAGASSDAADALGVMAGRPVTDRGMLQSKSAPPRSTGGSERAGATGTSSGAGAGPRLRRGGEEGGAESVFEGGGLVGGRGDGGVGDGGVGDDAAAARGDNASRGDDAPVAAAPRGELDRR